MLTNFEYSKTNISVKKFSRFKIFIKVKIILEFYFVAKVINNKTN